MHDREVVTVGPNLPALVGLQAACWVMFNVCIAGALVTLLGRARLQSGGWVWLAVMAGVTTACFGLVILTAVIGRRPRVEFNSVGFRYQHLFQSRSRNWDDVAGGFHLITLGRQRCIAYHLTESCRRAAGIEPTTRLGGYDEAISGMFARSLDELTQLLNRYKLAVDPPPPV